MIKYSKDVIGISTKLLNNHSCVIMCSSGVDSIAATHYILSNNKDVNRYYVYHFNHKLRPQNDVMESSIHRFMMNEFPEYIYYTPCREENAKTESDLRKQRLSHLTSMYHLHTIITAHHLDDCVESYLMNCFRGHEDYLPIPFWSEFLDKDAHTKNVITHPFLFTKKQDFIDYAEKHDLMKYVVEDETNTVTKGSRRNLIRNEIVPILAKEKMGLDTIVKKKLKQRFILEMLKHL